MLKTLAAAAALLARGGKRIPPGLAYFSFDNFRARVHTIINELRK